MKRKLFIPLLVCLFAALFAAAFTACAEEEQPPEEPGISFATPTLTLEEEQTYQLVLQGAEAAAAEWRSDDLTVASVSSGGLVTANAAGSTVIRATVGEDTAMCQLTVTPYRPQAVLSLSLNKTQLSLYETDTFALVCTARLGSEEVTPDSVTYASSAESVATVSGGTVTAEGVGTAEITVTAVYGGQTAESTVSVTVSEARTVLVADFGEREVLAGEPLPLAMTVMKGKEIVEDFGGVTFTLSDDTVGAVEDGVFTGTQKGSTVITAKCTVEGEELSLQIPMRVREQYTVTFTSEGQQVAQATVLDGETAALPADPTPPADRTFSRWVWNGEEFTDSVEVQQDVTAVASWQAPTSFAFESAIRVNVHTYSSLSEFATDVTLYNDTWPDGSAVLQPQGGETGRPSKADWYVELPAFDFSAYNGVYFTFRYNHAGKVSIEGQEAIAATAAGYDYLFGVLRQDGQWVLTMEGRTLMSLSDAIATGEEGLRFDFVLNTETDNYAQLTFSAMFRYEVDYMAEAEAALAAIPEAASLTAENCTQYEDELEAYLAAAELFTEYEQTANPVPEKIIRLQELLAQPGVPAALNEYTAKGVLTDNPELNGLVWGEVGHQAWINGDVYAFAVNGNTITRLIGTEASHLIENGGRFDTDTASSEHRVFLPKIDFTVFTKVTIAVRTNNGAYIGVTNDTEERLPFSDENEVGYSGSISFAYADGVLTVTLAIGDQTKTTTVTDTDVINGAERFTFTVWAAAQYTQLHLGQIMVQRNAQ